MCMLYFSPNILLFLVQNDKWVNLKTGQCLLSSIYNFVQARSPTVFIDLCETRKALIAGIILRPLKISVVWTCSDPGLDRSLCASSGRQSRSHILTPSVLAHTFLQRQRHSLLCFVPSSWKCSSLWGIGAQTWETFSPSRFDNQPSHHSQYSYKFDHGIKFLNSYRQKLWIFTINIQSVLLSKRVIFVNSIITCYRSKRQRTPTRDWRPCQKYEVVRQTKQNKFRSN